MGDVQRVGWEAGALAEEADEAELADAGGGGELVEADVPLRPVGEVVAGQAERPVVAGAERLIAAGGRVESARSAREPIGEPFVALEPGGGRSSAVCI